MAGLYYIAELVEEYTTAARRVILFMISFTIFVYTMFIFCDDLPWRMVIMGFVTQAFHLAIMGNFPFIKFLSIPFIGSVVCLILNHFLAFQYFTSFYYPFTQVSEIYKLFISLVIIWVFVGFSLLYYMLMAGTFCFICLVKC